MGFLDDLKRQAEELQARQAGGLGDIARNTQLAEAAAAQVQRYLLELCNQLKVIKPRSKAHFRFDSRSEVAGLPMDDFRFDSRKKIVNDREMTDHVLLSGMARSGQRFELTKNFIGDIEKLEARLRQGGVAFDSEPVRNHDTGKLVEVRYTYVADVRVSVRVAPVHERGVLQFGIHNLEGLESLECEFPAHEVTQARLDELARWWVGQPHRILDSAAALRRNEPR